MFHLKPRTDVTFEQLHSTTTLGKLDIVWMSGFGERGRLQTNQLPKPVSERSRRASKEHRLLALDSIDRHNQSWLPA